MTEEMRERFEKWVREEFTGITDLRWDSNGKYYTNGITNCMWMAWQAALSSAAGRAGRRAHPTAQRNWHG